jgi:hypothetical protein
MSVGTRRPAELQLRNRTVPTERPLLVGEVRGVAWSAQHIPTAGNLGFLHRSRYLSIQVTPQLL